MRPMNSPFTTEMCSSLWSPTRSCFVASARTSNVDLLGENGRFGHNYSTLGNSGGGRYSGS